MYLIYIPKLIYIYIYSHLHICRSVSSMPIHTYMHVGGHRSGRENSSRSGNKLWLFMGLTSLFWTGVLALGNGEKHPGCVWCSECPQASLFVSVIEGVRAQGGGSWGAWECQQGWAPRLRSSKVVTAFKSRSEYSPLGGLVCFVAMETTLSQRRPIRPTS